MRSAPVAAGEPGLRRTGPAIRSSRAGRRGAPATDPVINGTPANTSRRPMARGSVGGPRSGRPRPKYKSPEVGEQPISRDLGRRHLAFGHDLRYGFRGPLERMG